MERFTIITLTAAVLSTAFKGVNGISSVTNLRTIRPYIKDYDDANMTDDEWNSMPSNTDYDDRDEAVNSIAASTINFLETGGFNFESEKDIIGLLSFLEATTGASIQNAKTSNGILKNLKEAGKQIYHHTKEFASKHAKGAVGEAVKIAIVAILKKGLPVFEKTYEDAMQRIPLSLRITYAPMAYNLWNELFKKFKIELPEELTPERFICKGMTKEQCDDVVNRAIKASKKKKASEYAARNEGEGSESDEEEEEEGGGDIALSLEDF